MPIPPESAESTVNRHGRGGVASRSIEGTTAKLYAYVLEYGTTVETVVFTLHQNEHAGIVIHLHGMQEKPPVARRRPALPPNAPFARQIPASSTNPAEIRAIFWLSVLIATLQNGCKRQRAPLIGTTGPARQPCASHSHQSMPTGPPFASRRVGSFQDILIPRTTS
jgi:hypothetical protein